MINKYINKFILSLPQENIKPNSQLNANLGSKNINVLSFCILYNKYIKNIRKDYLNSITIYFFSSNKYKLEFNDIIVKYLIKSIPNLNLKKYKLFWINYITEEDLFYILEKKFNYFNINMFLFNTLKKTIKSYMLILKFLNEF